MMKRLCCLLVSLLMLLSVFSVTEFDAGGWAALVSTMTVNSKSDITFQLTSEMEIRI